LIYENKKLAISGITGVLIASLIITSIVLAPWSKPATSGSLGNPPPGYPAWPLDMVKLFISNVTEPLGVGSEAVLTVIVTSPYDISNVMMKLDLLQVVDDLSIGIVFLGNLTTWNGDLRANISVSFNVRIKAVEVGYVRIKATLKWYYEPLDQHMELPDIRNSVWILVSENYIQVSQEPITPPDYYEAKPSNETLPIWPNGTLWEP
jgi:hypothetical protein